MRPGDIVIRHDQPAQQGTVIHVAGDVIYVDWHGQSPSYEHIRDLCQAPTQGHKKSPGTGTGAKVSATSGC